MKKIDRLIRRLVIFQGNEASFMTEESRKDLDKLIVEVVRIKYGIRYHEYSRECPCQPECKIREIFTGNHELHRHLEQEDISDLIVGIVANPINTKITIWGKE